MVIMPNNQYDIKAVIISLVLLMGFRGGELMHQLRIVCGKRTAILRKIPVVCLLSIALDNKHF